MSETMDSFEVSHPSTGHFFKLPGLLAFLTIGCFLAAIAFGAGPCGTTTGMYFLLAVPLFGCATLIAFAVNTARAISNRRSRRV